MPNEFKADYDSEEDLLYLYNESKKSSGSIEFGDLVLELGKKGETYEDIILRLIKARK